MRTSTFIRSTGIALVLAAAAPAFADDQSTPAAPPAAPADAAAAPAAPTPFLKWSGHVEVGDTATTQTGARSLNWGHLFTDRDGEVLLNQASIAVEHDIDSSSKKTNWGFRVQGVYGADARYTHTLGILNNTTDGINQFDFFEADVQAHFPVLTPGGMDVKAGIYPTLLGAEVMDATGNFFY
ncbi:MAG: outer membrane beta-barrel protein, partial [Alphaproteobacteria bacterium]|nr:outer membrane beta-barrel protein [Alphaproteobacteria bacterium]